MRDVIRLRSPTTSTVLLILLAVTVGAGTAVASTALFYQTFPAIPAPVPGLSTSCAGGTLAYYTHPTYSFNTFNCSAAPAFIVIESGVVATPTFTLPTGYSDLYIFVTGGAMSATSCSTATGAHALTSGTSVSFGGIGSWDYCADYHATSLSSFTITWSQ